MKDVLLALTGGDECDAVSVIDDRVSKSDPLSGRFGRVLDESDPSVLLREKRVAREEGAGVAVRTHAEEDEVKDRVPGGVSLGERRDELTLVLVRELFRVVEEGDVDRVHLGRRDGRVVEEELLDRGIVGVLVLQADEPLVAEEDLPESRTREWDRGQLRAEKIETEGSVWVVERHICCQAPSV